MRSAEPIPPADPRAVGGYRAKAGLPGGEIDLAADIGRASLEADVAAELRQSVFARDHPLRKHLSPAVEAGERFAEFAIDDEDRIVDQKPARRTGEPLRRHRPDDVRPARDDLQADQRIDVGCRAETRSQARAGRGKFAVEPAGEIARALDCKAERAEWSLEADGSVGDIHGDIGKCERLVGGRREQLRHVAPDDAPVDHLALQANAACNHPIHFDAAVPAHPELDHRIVGDKVRILRIADDKIANHLGPKADTLEIVGRLNTALLKLIFDDIAGDRAPGDPDGRDRNQQHQHDRKTDDAGDTAPPAGAPDERLPRASALF